MNPSKRFVRCPGTIFEEARDDVIEGRGRGAVMGWARILAYVTGTVDQELLARNEYLAAGNHRGKANVLLLPRATGRQREGPVQCRERLGGLLRYDHEEAV